MKIAALLGSILVLTLLHVATSSLTVDSLAAPQTSTITLYAKNKYRNDPRALCFNLETGSTVRRGDRCDLHYGTLYAGNDFDWIQSGAAASNRSVIKDLGLQEWTAAFNVPVVLPLPKLKPGEQRTVTINTSGADGADGTPGTRGINGPDADGVVRRTDEPQMVKVPARPRHDGVPRIDPLFVKAVVGHMYVIHVVDQFSDFYALFRVEALEKGDKCTISWRLIPAPQEQTEEAAK